MAVTRFQNDYVPEFVGATLQLREYNGYHDSDFYAIVYDAEKDAVTSVQYGTTRGGGSGHATVDATPEVIEKARAAAARQAVERFKVATQFEAKETNHKGRKVTPTKDFNGRKQPSVKAGEVGTVTAVAVDRFKQGWQGRDRYRVKVEFEDGREVWFDEDRVEVVNPEDYEAPESFLWERARNWVQSFGNGASWESLFYAGFSRFEGQLKQLREETV